MLILSAQSQSQAVQGREPRPPGHPATTPPRHHAAGPPGHHATAPPRRRATRPPRHRVTTPPGHPATTPPRHRATTPPGHPATTPPRHRATTPPGHPATTPPRHRATTPPGHPATTPPRHHAAGPPGHHATAPPRRRATRPPRHHAAGPPGHHATTPPGHPATTPPGHPATTPLGRYATNTRCTPFKMPHRHLSSFFPGSLGPPTPTVPRHTSITAHTSATRGCIKDNAASTPAVTVQLPNAEPVSRLEMFIIDTKASSKYFHGNFEGLRIHLLRTVMLMRSYPEERAPKLTKFDGDSEVRPPAI
ncbi:uncharacterized protein LOC125719299 [Brienomyrus brachyistius]|uniref:uncharacterized protein LOC125719299 n=1 Tax=Brienomyrus brachyistius TaxID=42636 RepID=UPI0020B2A7FD|nr:uncharacterized protein LOC125719299 [Brienomyrus brachyistius]